MAVTETGDIFVPEILTDHVQGMFKGKNALMGSILVSSGAVFVSGTMPKSGPGVIGTTIRMPYFGTIPAFSSNAEGSSATPQEIKSHYEDATVGRYSLAFEASVWSQGAGEITGMDPYDEATRQIGVRAEQCIDSQLVTAGQGSALVEDLYSASSPHYMQYADVALAKARKLGDESSGIVSMVVHSLVMGDLQSTLDTLGRPILTTPQDGGVPRLAGIPLIESDSMPLTGSTMGTMTLQAGGTGSATFALTGTPLGPWDLRIKVMTTGEAGTATIQFSTDGGNTYSATLTTAATGVALPLIDTAVDSLVGKNGQTGISVTFTSGAGNDLVATEVYSATANLCVESQIWTQGSGAFWYNANAMELKTDKDILEDTDIAAMHIYGCAHLYRRRAGGTRPGVVRIKTNVSHFVG